MNNIDKYNIDTGYIVQIGINIKETYNSFDQIVFTIMYTTQGGTLDMQDIHRF